MYSDARRVIEEYDDADSLHSRRDLVEARLVTRALAELGRPEEAEVDSRADSPSAVGPHTQQERP